jgi:hypothetical protein
VTLKSEIPVDAFDLDEAEVDAVKYVSVEQLAAMYAAEDPTLVPADTSGEVLCPSHPAVWFLCVLYTIQGLWLLCVHVKGHAWLSHTLGKYGKHMMKQ